MNNNFNKYIIEQLLEALALKQTDGEMVGFI